VERLLKPSTYIPGSLRGTGRAATRFTRSLVFLFRNAPGMYLKPQAPVTPDGAF